MSTRGRGGKGKKKKKEGAPSSAWCRGEGEEKGKERYIFLRRESGEKGGRRKKEKKEEKNPLFFSCPFGTGEKGKGGGKGKRPLFLLDARGGRGGRERGCFFITQFFFLSKARGRVGEKGERGKWKRGEGERKAHLSLYFFTSFRKETGEKGEGGGDGFVSFFSQYHGPGRGKKRGRCPRRMLKEGEERRENFFYYYSQICIVGGGGEGGRRRVGTPPLPSLHHYHELAR